MKSDFVKTLNFLKKNGPVKTFWAIRERLEEKKKPAYRYEGISHEERLNQVGFLENSILFSILVPSYETKPEYMKGLIDSVRNQTYNRWELIIADASSTSAVEDVVGQYADDRIKYHRLEKNLGISGNTNEGLKFCKGDYIALLDHDDLLTQQALFENAARIRHFKDDGIELQMLYSDEDKTDSENTMFFELNIKPGFNLDLILSNNYICHFLVIKAELMKELGLRSEFDGAQDHDLILRVVSRLIHRETKTDSPGRIPVTFEKYIHHIPEVLYHWRCHEASTAANPKSKLYAYESGKRAVQDFLDREGIKGKAVDLPHMGFFEIEYEEGILKARPDVGAVGFRIIGKNNRVTGGIFDENMNIMFEGLNVHYSGGYLHRAACFEDVFGVDIRSMLPCDRGIEVLGRIMKKQENPDSQNFLEISREFSDTMKNEGYRLLYNPKITVKEKNLPGQDGI